MQLVKKVREYHAENKQLKSELDTLRTDNRELKENSSGISIAAIHHIVESS